MRSISKRQYISVLLPILLITTAVMAQTPQFTSLPTGHVIDSAQAVGGSVYGGMAKGGLVEWNPGSESVRRFLTRSDGLGGNFVTDLAYTGVSLWVATADGGLTAMINPGSNNESLRNYSSALSSLAITSVTGLVVGSNERVYYGTQSDGIGEITGGLPGAYYTEQNGLIDDSIDALAMNDAIVLIATPTGISRFANNTFQNFTFSNPAEERVNAMGMTEDGTIYAACERGLRRWNDELLMFEMITGGTLVFRDVAFDGNTVYAVSVNNHVFRYADEVASEIQEFPTAPDDYDQDAYSVAARNGEVWVGGKADTDAMTTEAGNSSEPWFGWADRAGAEIDIFDTCIIGVPGGFDGVAFDHRNRPWFGGRSGDGLAGYTGDGWYNIYELATAANDSNGLFNHSGAVLSIASHEGTLWSCQFTIGGMGIEPADEPGGQEEWSLHYEWGRPNQGRRYIEVATHPDGQVFFCTDGEGTDVDLAVDVLVDPEHSRDEAAWIHLTPAMVGGNAVRAVAVERRDRIWFAVIGVGLRVWDINGEAGPDDPLTWTDFSDDIWNPVPIRFVGDSSLDLGGTNAIVVDQRGHLWVGGAGLVEMTYDHFFDEVTLVTEWEQKDQVFVDGLLGQSVQGLGIDRNADLWALTSGGLNCLHFDEDGVVLEVDAYTDLASYFDLDPALYSPSIIVAMPGGTYRRMAASQDGSRLAMTTDLGACMVSVPVKGDTGPADLSEAYIYPNPFPGSGGDGSLHLGGVDTDESSAEVDILNLEGQVVAKSAGVLLDSAFWDGTNRQGRPVASGLYLVRIEHAGEVVVRTLAIAY